MSLRARSHAAAGALAAVICAAGLITAGCGQIEGKDGSSEPSSSTPAAVTSTTLAEGLPTTPTTTVAPDSDADALGDEVDGLLEDLGADNEAADSLEDVSELD